MEMRTKRVIIDSCGGDSTVGNSKKRRRFSASEDDDFSSMCMSKRNVSPSISRIYNSTYKNSKPAELFRKDLISAMKLPDNEQLEPDSFWYVSDPWKQEWERGVQVPVNSKHVPIPEVGTIKKSNKVCSFKLPKKLIRCTHDDFFSNEEHVLVNTSAEAEKACRYDMDDLDCNWLTIFNETRIDIGLSIIDETTMELLLEDFENQCFEKFQEAVKTEEGLGIEYDEDVVCDVCRSPDSEEGNEMVFCDSCNLCVHQACYGITTIPEGSWICRPCALNVQPPCILCPNPGGAMKSTRSGQKWAHVSCALWIPEVSIGCAEKMEPIMKISQIPASRWALICTLCRDRTGACIQCSVKQCKVAYHVTCAFEQDLEMKALFDEAGEDVGVKLKSYCLKHSRKQEETNPSIQYMGSKNKRKCKRGIKDELTDEDRHNARLQKIRMMEAEFHNYVNIGDTAVIHNISPDIVEFIFNYWKLKRKANFNKALITAKADESNFLGRQQENSLYAKTKLFVRLRQDLERVRNLCYMVGRREKLFRSWLRIKEKIFWKQEEDLIDKSLKLTTADIEKILGVSHGDSIYDKMYSYEIPVPVEECDENKECASNSIHKNKLVSPRLPNPYAKCYLKGIYSRTRRRDSQESHADNHSCDKKQEFLTSESGCGFNLEEIPQTSVASLNLDSDRSSHNPVVIKVEPKSQENIESKSCSEMGKYSDNQSCNAGSTSELNVLDQPIIEKVKLDAPPSDSNSVSLRGLKKEITDDLYETEQNANKENAGCETNNHKLIKCDLGENVNTSIDALSSNDKENIVSRPRGRLRKPKTQIEIKSKDFSQNSRDIVIDQDGEKSIALLNDCCCDNVQNVILDTPEKQTSDPHESKSDTRNTRYQIRTRNKSSCSQQDAKSVQFSPPSCKYQLVEKDISGNFVDVISDDTPARKSNLQADSGKSKTSCNSQFQKGYVEISVADSTLGSVGIKESIRIRRQPNRSIWPHRHLTRYHSKLFGNRKNHKLQRHQNADLSANIESFGNDVSVCNLTQRKMSLRHYAEETSSFCNENSELRNNEKSHPVALQLLDAAVQLPFSDTPEHAFSCNSSSSNEVKHSLNDAHESNHTSHLVSDLSPQMHVLDNVDNPASPRLVIRLRKDPDCQNWQNDAVSNESSAAAFRVVRNDWGGDDNKHVAPLTFSSIHENRLLSPEYPEIVEHKNNGSRYSMRTRSSKCTFGIS